MPSGIATSIELATHQPFDVFNPLQSLGVFEV
jgi:hypothetical protein